jgi:hypothetical protein
MVGVLTVLILGIAGVVWVGASPLGGGAVLAMAAVRLVLLVRELRHGVRSEELHRRLAQLDKEIAESDTRLEGQDDPGDPDADT